MTIFYRHLPDISSLCVRPGTSPRQRAASVLSGLAGTCCRKATPSTVGAVSGVLNWDPAFYQVPLALSLVELTEEILKLLMELVFRLVCSGELSLARVLRKNILDKVDQKKLLRCAHSDQPLAARGVAAR